MGTKTGVRVLDDRTLQIEFKLGGALKAESIRVRVKIDTTKAKNIREWEGKKVEIDRKIQNNEFDYTEYFPNINKRLAEKISKFDTKGVRYKSMTVSQLIDEYMVAADPQENTRYQVGQSTYDDYINKAEILKQGLGNYLVTELTIDHVLDFVDKKNWRQRNASNHLAVLRGGYNVAKGRGLQNNIFADWKLEVKQSENEEDMEYNPQPFTRDEMHALYESCEERDDYQFLNLIKFVAWSGLRPNEYLALRWEDIDFTAKTINIRRFMVNGRIKTRGKTAAAKRIVRLQPPAEEALRHQMQYTRFLKAEIFHNPHDGKPWKNSKAVRARFVRLVRYAEIEYRNPYQLRHTFASMMFCSDPKLSGWLSEQLGHKDKSMVPRIYAQFLPTEEAPGMSAVELYA